MKTAAPAPLPFGIRVSLPANDPFAALVGDTWSTTHWFATQAERDRVMRDMQRRHEYSRRTDTPAIRLEAVKRV